VAVNEFQKATLKTLLTGLLAGFISLQTSINASGMDSYGELFRRPSTLLMILIAMIPVAIGSLSKSPSQGAAMDRAIEAKADAKAEAKVAQAVDTMIQTGTIQVKVQP
jgi:high-affinity K+ transport system ATPase subunit B